MAIETCAQQFFEYHAAKNSSVAEEGRMVVNADLGRIALTTLVVVGIGGVPLAAAQDSFQVEAGLSYTRAKGESARQDTALLDATYFFDRLPLRSGDQPLEQIPFVERASRLTAYYSRGSPDIEGLETVKDPSSYNVAIQFIPPDTPLILGAGYSSSFSGRYRDSRGTGSYDTETDVRGYQLQLGSYVDKTTAVTLDWSRSEGKGRITSNTFNATPTYDSTSIGISGLHLGRLADGGHIAVWAWINQSTFDPEGAPSEKNQTYFFQTTYYPNRMLGLWLGVQVDRGDSTSLEGETYVAGASMFVTQDASLGLGYLRFQGKVSDNNANAVTLSGRMRF